MAAVFKNGVLAVTLPEAPGAKGNIVPVQAEQAPERPFLAQSSSPPSGPADRVLTGAGAAWQYRPPALWWKGDRRGGRPTE